MMKRTHSPSGGTEDWSQSPASVSWTKTDQLFDDFWQSPNDRAMMGTINGTNDVLGRVGIVDGGYSFRLRPTALTSKYHTEYNTAYIGVSGHPGRRR